MTLSDLEARIAALEPEQRHEYQYLKEERLAILCLDQVPTPELVEIVVRQLFPNCE